ncbi:hypothetical protein [Vacuolonema iberomarrocanum]|uniref:hypothetical protein n=1 Tax=Vacuolonema iberomarrocanum TaxID=3454632 RepID=UPI0019E983B9|nr:hypothetical protein [filamentous cyanobacterium LEGE 07170]
MKKFHLAIATHDIAATVRDYSDRLGAQPCVVVPNEYALWRTETLNLSIRQDPNCKSGELRHLGWEDSAAQGFTTSVDVNGLTWERFSPLLQAQEIEEIWPGTQYTTDARG